MKIDFLGQLINHIPLEWVSIWHSLLFFFYLRDGFCSEYEDVSGNRVNPIRVGGGAESLDIQ